MGLDEEPPKVHFSSKLDLIEKSIYVLLNDGNKDLINLKGNIDNQNITG